MPNRFWILLLFMAGLLPSAHALKVKCDTFAVNDSIVMDYYYNDEIVRYVAFYKSGEICQLQGYKKAKQPYFCKYYKDNVVDSIIYYDDKGRPDYKVRFQYTPARKALMGRQFNTRENLLSKYMGRTDDVTVKTIETYDYNTKTMELVHRNEKLVSLTVYDEIKPKKFNQPKTMDSVIQNKRMPFIEEDLTGRPPAEISECIKSNREMRDLVSRCLSRYNDTKGEIVVEFPVLRDGSVPGILILKSTFPCKNIGVELMNVFKNISFKNNPQYGTVTVTYPFQPFQNR